MSPPLTVRLCLMILRTVLRAYPSCFRRRFGSDVQQNARVDLQHAHAEGTIALLRTCLWTLSDAAIGLPPALVRAARHALVPSRIELRQTARVLRRAPWYSATVVTVIALATVLSTTIFTIVDGVLFKPLHYRAPHQLITVDIQVPLEGGGFTRPGAGAGDLLAWEGGTPPLAAAGLNPGRDETLGDGVNELTVGTAEVTADLFELLGVAPLTGGFAAAHFSPSATGVPRPAIITYSLWQRRFGGAPGVIGQRVVTDPERGGAFEIVGVMPRGFVLPLERETHVFYPLLGRGETAPRVERVIARLPPELAVEPAGQRLEAVLRSAARDGTGPPVPTIQAIPGPPTARGGRTVVQRPSPNAGAAARISSRPLEDAMRATDRPLFLAAFGGAVAMVLLGCLCAAGLVAARGEYRRHELAVRRAIGAGSIVIARLTTIEATLLAAAGSALGIAAAFPALTATLRLLPPELHLLKSPEIDWRVAAFAVAAGITTSVVVSAWSSIAALRACPARWMHEPGGTVKTPLASRLIVVGCVAFALALTLAGSLTVASLAKVRGNSLGFVPDDVVAIELRLRTGPAALQTEVATLIDRVRRVRGVVGAGVTDGRLLVRGGTHTSLLAPLDAAPEVSVLQHAVSPGFLDVVRPPVVMGRLPAAAELAREDLIVITDGMARAWLPGRDPIGQVLEAESGGAFTVAAVVADPRYLAWDFPAVACAYVPYERFARSRTPTLLVRTDPAGADFAAIRQALTGAPGIRPVRMDPLRTRLESTIRGFRFLTWLFTAFAAAALLLVGAAMFGLIAANAGRRTREVGVRLAMGATPALVVRLLLREQLATVLIGVVIGTGIGWQSLPLLKHYVYDVSAHDPRVWAAALAVVLSTTTAGVLIPAARASRTDPVLALRAE